MMPPMASIKYASERIWQLTTCPRTTKMRGMSYATLPVILIGSVSAALYAADSPGSIAEAEAYAQLAAGLRREVQLLSSITNADSAAAAVEPLSKLLQEFAKLNSDVDEKELWLYIDNTPDLKQPLIEEIERLFVQLQRLEIAKFYNCAPLKKLLAPIITPPADTKPRRSPSAAAGPGGAPAQHP